MSQLNTLHYFFGKVMLRWLMKTKVKVMISFWQTFFLTNAFICDSQSFIHEAISLWNTHFVTFACGTSPYLIDRIPNNFVPLNLDIQQWLAFSKSSIDDVEYFILFGIFCIILTHADIGTCMTGGVVLVYSPSKRFEAGVSFFILLPRDL